MNGSWIIHVLALINVAVFYFFIKKNPEFGKWGKGFWFVLMAFTLFLYVRTVFARWISVPGSWDDLVFGVLFAFAAYAMLSAMGSTWLYLLYKRRKNK